MYNRLTSFVFFSRVDTMNRIYWILSLEYAFGGPAKAFVPQACVEL